MTEPTGRSPSEIIESVTRDRDWLRERGNRFLQERDEARDERDALMSKLVAVMSQRDVALKERDHYCDRVAQLGQESPPERLNAALDDLGVLSMRVHALEKAAVTALTQYTFHPMTRLEALRLKVGDVLNGMADRVVSPVIVPPDAAELIRDEIRRQQQHEAD